MFYIFVYKKNNEYYYKLKDKVYFFTHPLGYTNGYGHELILIIPISSELYKKRHIFSLYHYILKKLISFLQFLDKR